MVVTHVVDVLVVRRPDDDDAAAHVQHVDRCAVQLRERLRGQHVVGLPDSASHSQGKDYAERARTSQHAVSWTAALSETPR